MQRLSRTLRALGKSSQAMMRAVDEVAYMNEVCSIVQGDCGHAMVWIGFAVNDKEKSIVPVAHAGFEEGYLDTLKLTWADSERGRGPTGSAVRMGQPFICRNMHTDPRFVPWRKEALRRGYASSIALPLMSGSNAFGAITIYSREADPFSDDEVKLLSELAGDLSYGLTALRLRASQHTAEQSLRESEERHRSLFENMTEGFALHEIITDSHGSPRDYRFLEVNPSFEKLTGLKCSDLLGKRVLEVLPGIEPVWIQRYGKVALTGEPTRFENYSANLGRWYEVFAYRPAPMQFAVIFSDITERKKAEDERRQVEERVRKKLESVLMPEGDLGVLDLGDLIDVPAMQTLMDDFYAVARFPMSIVDMKGRVLVGVGWQEICAGYHRVHSETCKRCIESDLQLSAGVPEGEFRLYRCKNNLWDIATPIIVAGRQVGNVFSGQFFFDDETVDREFFREQARQYGFSEDTYLAALDQVPRLSRETVKNGMAFLLKLADTLSQLGFSNAKLARLLAERDRLTASLRRSEEWYRTLFTTMIEGFCTIEVIFDPSGRAIDYRFLEINPAFEAQTGLHDARGKLMRDLAPNLEEHWFEIYGRVAITGEPVRFENEAKALNRWYEVSAFRVGEPDEHKVAILFNDISQRKKAADILQRAHDELEVRVRERTAALKKTSEALDAERQRFMEVLDVLPAYVVLLAPDHQVRFANRYFVQRFGKSQGRRCYEYLFNRTEPCEVCESFRPFTENGPVKWEWTGPDDCIYDISDFPFTDTDGSKLVLEMGIDITNRKRAEAELERHRLHLEDLVGERTSQLSAANVLLQSEIAERKEAEQALRESEERFRLAIQHSKLMAWECDKDMRFSWVYNSHFGVGEEHLLGKNPAELGNEIGMREFTGHCSEVLSRGTGFRKTIKHVHPDGREQYFDQQVEVVRDAIGGIMGLIGISLDVTERVQSEQRLHRSEESFRLMVGHSAEPLLLVEETGMIECISKKAADQLGYSEVDLVGSSVERFLDWSGKLDLTMRLEDFLRHAPLPARAVLRVKARSGSWLWIDVQASFVNYGQRPEKYLLKFELISTETVK
jgi:PAS domain S-box-containing protein